MYKTPKETIILSIKEWITADSSSIKSQIFPKLLSKTKIQNHSQDKNDREGKRRK